MLYYKMSCFGIQKIICIFVANTPIMIKTRLLITYLFLSFTTLLLAHTIKGKVVDAQSKRPLSFVSVYLNSMPQKGMTTDSLGHFQIEIPSLNTKDHLIFSFIGYKTSSITLSKINPKAQLQVLLKEQALLLEEMIVKPFPNDKRSRREFMKQLLEEIEAQIKIDYASNNRDYQVANNLALYKEGVKLLHANVLTHVHELPIKSHNNKDSIQVRIDKIDEYVKPQLEYTLAKAIKVSAKDEKLSIKTDTTAHKMTPQEVRQEKENNYIALQEGVWKINVPEIFDECKNHIKRWKYEGTQEDYMVLSYYYKLNAIGIVNIKTRFLFYIDPMTNSIMSISNVTSAKVNIPFFGYKLPPEALTVLNALNMGERKIKKYRLKKIHMHAVSNLSMSHVNDELVVNEKRTNTVLDIKNLRGKKTAVRIRGISKATHVDLKKEKKASN